MSISPTSASRSRAAIDYIDVPPVKYTMAVNIGKLGEGPCQPKQQARDSG